MADILIIVESPAKARTIARFLSNRYQVKATMGHIRDLPKSQFGIDVENHYQPKYITIRGKGELLKELKSAAKKAKRVYLATDPDREGEAISWHLAGVLGIDPGQDCRIEFHEITEKAVKEALQNPRPIDLCYVDAQQARRVLDRIVGYQLSPLLWRKLRYGLSAGRVQSVAVAMITDREQEIASFVPEEYWSLAVHCSKEMTAIRAKLIEIKGEKPILSCREDVDNLINTLGPVCEIVAYKKGIRQRQPAAPFTTSTLQQEASRKLGFTARKTMMLAQQLYEGIELGPEGPVGLVTYIRTDSTTISDMAFDSVKEYIHNTYGSEFTLENKRVFANKKGAQEAHEAIRPTDVKRNLYQLSDFLSRDQLKLYRLIWERFTASQTASALYDYVTADLKNADAIFRLNGSVQTFPGFLIIVKSEEEEIEDNLGFLPQLEIGQKIPAGEWVPEQHFTQSPARYNEALLIKTMEELGIGRPSTYAPTIDTILKRGYVERKEKRFYPTELGSAVTDMLREYFATVIDTEFTADLENKLDQVEDGELPWTEAIDDFYLPFSVQLSEAEKNIPVQEVEDEVTDEICELCGRNMVIKRGRFGSFLACPGYPECKNTKNIVVSLDIPCPLCKEGQLIERRSRKGRTFTGCSRYPNCQYVSWDKPVQRECPICGNLGMSQKIQRKKGTIIFHCLQTDCEGLLEVELEDTNEDGEA
jgi:DNA topoisomerase-1